MLSKIKSKYVSSVTSISMLWYNDAVWTVIKGS